MPGIMLSMLKFLVGIVVLCLALSYALWELPDGRFYVWFLDVGQGDAIFVQSPEGHQILVDGGPDGRVLQELGEVMPFFDKTIDMIVLSHPDKDHVAGLVEVLKRYEVENVLFTGVNGGGGYYDEFLKILDDENILLTEGGVDFEIGGVLVDVLYPFEQLGGRDVVSLNESSVAVKVVYEDVSILLTGDLGIVREVEMMEAGLDLSADILKAGHHGSRHSSDLGFLGAVGAEIFVVQVGENGYGHPTPEVLERVELAGVREIRRNDLEGRVEFTF